MQAPPVFIRRKVRSLQTQYRAIVPPNESTNDGLEDVRAENERPELAAVNVLRCKLHQGRDLVPLLVYLMPAHDVDGDKQEAADEREDEEEIPQHAQKT